MAPSPPRLVEHGLPAHSPSLFWTRLRAGCCIHFRRDYQFLVFLKHSSKLILIFHSCHDNHLLKPSATMDEPPARGDVELDEANPLKRKSLPDPERQSGSPKRVKMERDDARTRHSPDAPKPVPVRQAEPPKKSLDEARARIAQEEKRRGMRLFGGLMGTLKQRPPNPHQQKRLEIEKRQKERLSQQRVVEIEELAEKKARMEEALAAENAKKKARIDETRGKESIKWEERVVRLRIFVGGSIS